MGIHSFQVHLNDPPKKRKQITSSQLDGQLCNNARPPGHCCPEEDSVSSSLSKRSELNHLGVPLLSSEDSLSLCDFPLCPSAIRVINRYNLSQQIASFLRRGGMKTSDLRYRQVREDQILRSKPDAIVRVLAQKASSFCHPSTAKFPLSGLGLTFGVASGIV